MRRIALAILLAALATPSLADPLLHPGHVLGNGTSSERTAQDTPIINVMNQSGNGVGIAEVYMTNPEPYHTYGDGVLTGNAFSSSSATFTPADASAHAPIQVWYAGTATTIAAPPQATAGVPSAPVPGAVFCYSGGGQPAATYNVRMTYVGSGGETLGSTRYSAACGANTLPQVYGPTQVYGAQSWNLYVGTGTETLQNPYPLQLGQAFTLRALISGAALPVANTTSIVPPLITTIATYVSAHSVTLTASAGTNVTAANFAYGIDQSTAINAALTACGAAGGGQVTIAAQYAVGSSIIIPDKCTLAGPNLTTFGNQNSGTSSLPDSTPAVVLVPPATIQPNNASGIAALGVFAFGIPQNNLATRLAIDAVSNFSGSGITSNAGNASDAQISNVYEIGFYDCMRDVQSQRWTVHNFWGQCNNGPLIDRNHDAPALFDNIEMLGFYGQNSNWKTTAYTITGMASSSGSIQATVTPTTGLQVGDFVVISGANVPGANNRWSIGADDGSGNITLANSQWAPATTGTWTAGAKTAVLANMNSLGVKQTIAGTGIGPGNSNTILGVNYQTNTIMLQYPTTVTETAQSVTMGNAAFTSGGVLTLQAGQTNNAAMTIRNGGGVMVNNLNTFGWNSCFDVTQTDTNANNKVRNIKASGVVCDDKVDPAETAINFTNSAAASLKPGAVQMTNVGVTDGFGQGFLVDVGSSAQAYNGGVLQIANLNIASEPSTQVAGTVLTGKAQLSNPNIAIGGGGVTKNFISIAKAANALHIAGGALSGTYIAIDSPAQSNVFVSSDTNIGSSSFGPPAGTPLSTPILVASASNATPSTTVAQYTTPGGDTAFGNSFNNSRQSVDVAWPVAGTFTGLTVSMPGLSAGSYLVGIEAAGTISPTLQCAVSSGSTNCTPTSPTASLTVAAGDKVAIEFCPYGNALADCTGGVAPVISNGQITISAIFTSTYNQEGVMIGGLPTTSMNATALQFTGPGAIAPWSTTEINVSSIMPVAGTIDNLNVEMSGAAGASAGYIYTLFKNGSATSLVAGDGSTTCGGASSTTCSDVAGCTVGAKTCTHAVTVAAGDTISVQQCPTNAATCVAGSAPTARSSRVSMRWVPTTIGQAILVAASDTVPGTGAGTRYGPIRGGTAWTTTEANEQNVTPQVPISMTVGNLIVAESAAPTGTRAFTAASSYGTPFGATTATPVSATITSSSTLTIGGVGSTPGAQDTTDTFAMSPSDFADYYLVSTGVQNAVTWLKASMTATVQ